MTQYSVTMDVVVTLIVEAHNDDDALFRATEMVYLAFPDSKLIDWKYIEETPHV